MKSQTTAPERPPVRMSPASARKAVLAALKGANRPLDAYQVARATGLSAMDAGRLLFSLAQERLAKTVDDTGTVNDLACRYQLV